MEFQTTPTTVLQNDSKIFTFKRVALVVVIQDFQVIPVALAVAKRYAETK